MRPIPCAASAKPLSKHVSQRPNDRSSVRVNATHTFARFANSSGNRVEAPHSATTKANVPSQQTLFCLCSRPPQPNFEHDTAAWIFLFGHSTFSLPYCRAFTSRSTNPTQTLLSNPQQVRQIRPLRHHRLDLPIARRHERRDARPMARDEAVAVRDHTDGHRAFSEYATVIVL